ncbi:hypothetical protein LN429_15990 [Pseudomonas syringae]|uniref:hypothetical protein n=1 Tax=Pseudomonas syringae TaxID=317 RepID=UPI00234C812F|nr:hypothetical protein [Pseudomonas syringae]MDC6536606.1 hypothetical protein [Pseudomonas syringae]
MNHPIQPLEADEQHSFRFKENKIVTYLLDHGGIDMNALAMLDFSAEDREQFAQLIGYPLAGFRELSYARADTLAVATTMARTGQTETESRIAYLEAELKALRSAMIAPVSRLYGIHPDDLTSSI